MSEATLGGQASGSRTAIRPAFNRPSCSPGRRSWPAAGPLDAPRDSVDLDGAPVIAPWNESPAPDRLRVPCNLHRQPAKRSPAVKSGPTGPSAASRAAAPLTGGRSGATWRPEPAINLEVSRTIIPGEPYFRWVSVGLRGDVNPVGRRETVSESAPDRVGVIGPLATFADGFREHLAKQGYMVRTKRESCCSCWRT